MWGAIAGAVISYVGASEANDARADQANSANAQMQNNSDTAYQRAVQDLKKADLNPMLAYSRGGASTPAMQQANIQDELTPAVNTAVSAYQASNEASVKKEQVSNLAADTGLKTATTAKTAAETEVAKTQAALNLVEAERVQSQTGVNSAQTAFTQANTEMVTQSLQKIAPEIRLMVSHANLNDAQRARAISELPLVAAQVQHTKAETDVAYERKLATQIETYLNRLKVNEASSVSNMWGTAYGRALPYVNSGSKALGNVTGAVSPWAWLFKK